MRLVLKFSGTLHTLEEHSLAVQEERAAQLAASIKLQQELFGAANAGGIPLN